MRAKCEFDHVKLRSTTFAVPKWEDQKHEPKFKKLILSFASEKKLLLARPTVLYFKATIKSTSTTTGT